MPSIKPGSAGPAEVETDLLVVAVTKGNELSELASRVDVAMEGALREHLFSTTPLGGRGKFEGKAGQAAILPTFGRIAARAVMVVGLGEAEKVDAEAVRRGIHRLSIGDSGHRRRNRGRR
ncbi:MAG TPA: M17 family peptidase N-terminal domain-containing protein [Actinomycetota bacterium]|nr:M17 family peptidase N-terminal domain-containing protein [Actinomycetota bacterium]